jgi:hypothetical protein
VGHRSDAATDTSKSNQSLEKIKLDTKSGTDNGHIISTPGHIISTPGHVSKVELLEIPLLVLSNCRSALRYVFFF